MALLISFKLAHVSEGGSFVSLRLVAVNVSLRQGIAGMMRWFTAMAIMSQSNETAQRVGFVLRKNNKSRSVYSFCCSCHYHYVDGSVMPIEGCDGCQAHPMQALDNRIVSKVVSHAGNTTNTWDHLCKFALCRCHLPVGSSNHRGRRPTQVCSSEVGTSALTF